MGVPYPKTFPKAQTSPYGVPANNNKPGYVYLPANDNKKGWRPKMIPFKDARLRFIQWAVSLTFDMVTRDRSWEEPLVGLPPTEAGVDFTGWHIHHDFGRVPHYAVAGSAGNGYTWPNVTVPTSFNYPFALAGYTGTPGFYDPTYVREFQGIPAGGLDPNDFFSVWHYHALESVSGWNYWRVSSAQTWGRDVGNTNPVPQYQPAQDAYYVWGDPLPSAPPMRVVRALSKYTHDVLGNPIRGPRPRERPWHRRDPWPRPPPRRTHERKISISIRGVGTAILNAVTESMDAVDAIYKALPEALRKQLFREHGGYMSPLDKAEALYKYTDQVDMQKMVQNLLMEAASDRLYGSIGRLTAKANALRNSPGGLQLGDALEGVSIKVS